MPRSLQLDNDLIYSLDDLDEFPPSYLENCVFKIIAIKRESGDEKNHDTIFGLRKMECEDTFIQIRKQTYSIGQKIHSLF